MLNDDERATLEGWACQVQESAGVGAPCRIVLDCTKGHTNRSVARDLGVRATGGTLHDEPHPSVPRSITEITSKR
jgi:hypothetical protein